MSHSPEDKERFYSALLDVVRNVPDTDKLLILGDFNARVGRSNPAWPGIIGWHSYGKVNSNGLLLLSLFAAENLVITNTIFNHKDAHKVTWVHPSAKCLGISALLKQAQLRWSGHVVRMDDSILPKQLFYAELSNGKRLAGGQRKRYKDSLKETLRAYHIPTHQWQQHAQDRVAWRTSLRKGTDCWSPIG